MNILTISKFGTICGKNFTEMFIDDFINEIENNLNDKKYDIRYNESKNEFVVIFNEQRYILKLDNETMKKYATGNYDQLTLRIKKIIDKAISREERERKKGLIISNAEVGILPDDESVEIYLEHLKQQKSKITTKKIIEYFENIRGDFATTQIETPEASYTYKWPFKRYYKTYTGVNDKYRVYDGEKLRFEMVMTGCILSLFLCGSEAYISTLSNPSIETLFNNVAPGVIALPLTTLTIPAVSFIKRYFEKRMKRLKTFINDRKLKKYKIKELTEMLKIGKSTCLTTGKSTSLKEFDSTISMTPIEDIAMFQDNIYQNINDLVNRLTYINKNDRLILAKELKSILDEYNSRVKALEENLKKGTITLGQDDIVKIKMDIISRIGVVETKLTAIRKKDLESSQRQSEQEIIERKLQQFSEEDITDEYTDDIEEASSVKILQKRASSKK